MVSQVLSREWLKLRGAAVVGIVKQVWMTTSTQNAQRCRGKCENLGEGRNSSPIEHR